MSDDTLRKQLAQQSLLQSMKGYQSQEEFDKRFLYQSPIAVDYQDEMHQENLAFISKLSGVKTKQKFFSSYDSVSPENYALPKMSIKDKREEMKQYEEAKKQYPDMTFEAYRAMKALRIRDDQRIRAQRLAMQIQKPGNAFDIRCVGIFCPKFLTKFEKDDMGVETEVPLNDEEAVKMQKAKDFITTMSGTDSKAQKVYLDEFTARMLQYEIKQDMFSKKFILSHPEYIAKLNDETVYYQNLSNTFASYYNSLPTLTRDRIRASKDVLMHYCAYAERVLRTEGVDVMGKIMSSYEKSLYSVEVEPIKEIALDSLSRYKKEFLPTMADEQKKVMSVADSHVESYFKNFKGKKLSDGEIPKEDDAQFVEIRTNITVGAKKAIESSDDFSGIPSHKIAALGMRESKSTLCAPTKVYRNMVFSKARENVHDFSAGLFASGIQWDMVERELTESQAVVSKFYSGPVFDSMVSAHFENFAEYLEQDECIKYIKFMYDQLIGAEVFKNNPKHCITYILQDLFNTSAANFSDISREYGRYDSQYGPAGAAFSQVSLKIGKTLMSLASMFEKDMEGELDAESVSKLPTRIKALYKEFGILVDWMVSATKAEPLSAEELAELQLKREQRREQKRQQQQQQHR